MQYTLIRSLRRTVSLQLKKGEVIVRAPHLYPKYLIDHFVESKTRWINKRLEEQQNIKKKLVRFCSDGDLKGLVEKYLDIYTRVMGLYPSAIKYKTTRSYWGSCAPNGVISFNLKLSYTSPQAVEYVVVHELAHLRYRGHGVRFWDLVKKYYPQTNDIRRVLRQHPRE